MTEQYTRPPFDTQSFEYGAAVVAIAATELQKDINTLIASADPAIEVIMKTAPRSPASPVTKFDKKTEKLIADFYEGTDTQVIGEEGMSSWPDGKIPALKVIVDPIDGTTLFIAYVKALIAWMKLPEHKRPPRPVCGSMVTAGALRPGNNTPEWGAIAAPFMSPDGIVRWTTSANTPAMRIEPDGSQHELPHASTLPTPEKGGVVLVSSDQTEELVGNNLTDAGFTVIKYTAAVAAALFLMDPGLFERLRPRELGDDAIVGAVMRGPKDWDVVAPVAMANKLGHFAGGVTGRSRRFNGGDDAAIFAVKKTIGRRIRRAAAPFLGS